MTKFVVESVSKYGGRIGLIKNVERLPDKTFKTPMLLYLHPQLSREVLELSGFELSKDFAISLPVSNVEQMEKPLEISGKGISDFWALKESLTFCSLKNGSIFSPSASQDKDSVPIYRKSERLNITPQRYMKMMEVFKPDFYTTLADGDSFKDCPKRRVAKASEKSRRFYEESVQLKKSSAVLKNSFMIGTIVGGFNEFERRKIVEEMNKKSEDVDGYFIDGLHRNGHEAAEIDVTSLKEIVSSTIAQLPQEKLKVMSGAYLPNVTLELIAQGIDLFDSSLVNLVTNANRAMVFNFNINKPAKLFPEIDLLDSKYKDDFKPFLEGCSCLACRKHTRAYTNHLLTTHELLGPMLLTIHNLHHYREFFATIRNAIASDKLKELTELISEQYQEAEGKLYYERKIDNKPGKYKENLIAKDFI
ncbi:CLUMA_CG007464, isoform A [Clunio marinus]|uniref:Queuine tRNA-ribosyltransferase accessory subunit 2 n=1 Tax=Clunio marinus TaxID=568069 RepID=A0A1J1I6B2_9DIPT|nr:CLUMA_CG007464, isoform A [Clunio marinus]